jgi:putative FmdB family regulatory protein
MPLYEYRCEKCGDVFEVMQKFSDQPLTQHEGCGGAVERLLSAPAFQFKGSGWYITDYARAGQGGKKDKEAGSKEGDSASKTDSNGSSKTETKTTSSDTGKTSSTPDSKSK